ncbi:MAG: ATP synthase F1 subunit delta [Erysipelotrichaceae bacterium]
MEKLIVKQYSDLLLELAIESASVEEIYQSFTDNVTLLNHADLQLALNHPRLSKVKKKALVEKIITTSSKLFKHFIFVVIEQNASSYLAEIFESFKHKVWKYQGKLELTVYSVVKLNDQQLLEIKQRMSQRMKKEIILTNKIDKSLISGIRLECDGLVLDNSLAKKITQLASQLKSEVQ